MASFDDPIGDAGDPSDGGASDEGGSAHASDDEAGAGDRPVNPYAGLTAAERTDAVVQLTGLMGAFQAELARVVVACDEARDWEPDGATDMAAWLAGHCAMAQSTARRTVKVSTKLMDLPCLHAALAEGAMSWEQICPATRFVTPDDDAEMAQILPGYSVEQIAALARQHRPRPNGEANDAHRRRRMTWRPDHEAGGCRYSGFAPFDQAAAINAVLTTLAEGAGPNPETGLWDPFAARCLDALHTLADAAAIDDTETSPTRRPDTSPPAPPSTATRNGSAPPSTATPSATAPSDTATGGQRGTAPDGTGAAPTGTGAGTGAAPTPRPTPTSTPTSPPARPTDTAGTPDAPGSPDAPAGASPATTDHSDREPHDHDGRPPPSSGSPPVDGPPGSDPPRPAATPAERMRAMLAGGVGCHVTIHVDEDILAGTAPGTGTIDGLPIGVGTVRRLLCDAQRSTTIEDTTGRAIGISRNAHDPPRWLRRHIEHRDRCCRFPGCNRPIRHLHHITWWTRDHGPTDAPNLTGLCWAHHRLVHEGGWTITGNADHQLTFHSPHGRQLTSRRQPTRATTRHAATDTLGLELPGDGDGDRGDAGETRDP